MPTAECRIRDVLHSALSIHTSIRASERNRTVVRILNLEPPNIEPPNLEPRNLRTTGSRSRIPDPASRPDITVYACGPEPMLEAVAHVAAKFDRPSQVSVERTMGCGMGGCYSCVIAVRTPDAPRHYVRSCIAGPVFRGEDLVWD